MAIRVPPPHSTTPARASCAPRMVWASASVVVGCTARVGVTPSIA